MKRVGIYAGTFDPVHAGHISFALQSLERANLDMVHFMPERRPRHKNGVEHFGHRVAMLKRACRPHPGFGVLELPDVSFDVKRTLTRVESYFQDAQLVFLCGSDVAKTIPSWPNAAKFLGEAELVVGLRNKETVADVRQAVGSWSDQPKALTVFLSHAPDISSGQIRRGLYERVWPKGLLTSVARYSDRNWLYVSIK